MASKYRYQVINGQIKKTFLGTKYSPFFTFEIHVESKKETYCFGGDMLDRYDVEQDKRLGRETGLNPIMTLLKVLRKDTWEELPGTYVRLRIRTKNGINPCAVGIGHIVEEEMLYKEGEELA